MKSLPEAITFLNRKWGKKCLDCGKFKPESEFYYNKPRLTTRRRRFAICKLCHLKRTNEHRRKRKKTNPDYRASERLRSREYSLRNKGLTVAIWNKFYALQGGKCLIRNCPNPIQATDHRKISETENRFRGLMCIRCNLVLGHVKDDPGVLNDLVIYTECDRDITENTPGAVAILAMARMAAEEKILTL